MVLHILFERAHPQLSTIKRLLLLFSYAALIEIVQAFLPTRFPAISDVIADSVGLLIGVIFVHQLRSLRLCSYCYR